MPPRKKASKRTKKTAQDDEPLVDYGAPPRDKCAPTRLFYEPDDDRGIPDEDDEGGSRRRVDHPEHCDCPSCTVDAVVGMFEAFNKQIIKPITGMDIEALPTSGDWIDRTFEDPEGAQYDFRLRRRPKRPPSPPDDEDDDEEDDDEPAPEYDLAADEFEIGSEGVKDKPDMPERRSKDKDKDKGGDEDE